MKSAFNDIIYEKRGIYGVLHVIILLLSLFLIVVISVDTFKNIPFMTQGSYLKINHLFPAFYPVGTQRICTGYRSRMVIFKQGFRTIRILPDHVAGNGLFLQPDILRDRT